MLYMKKAKNNTNVKKLGWINSKGEPNLTIPTIKKAIESINQGIEQILALPKLRISM